MGPASACYRKAPSSIGGAPGIGGTAVTLPNPYRGGGGRDPRSSHTCGTAGDSGRTGGALQAARLPHGAVTGREPPTPSSRTGTRGHAALPALLRRAKFWGEVLSPPTPLRSPSLPAGPGWILNAAPMLGAQPGSVLGVLAPRGAAVWGVPTGRPPTVGLGSRVEVAHGRAMQTQHRVLSPQSATHVPVLPQRSPPCTA